MIASFQQSSLVLKVPRCKFFSQSTITAFQCFPSKSDKNPNIPTKTKISCFDLVTCLTTAYAGVDVKVSCEEADGGAIT